MNRDLAGWLRCALIPGLLGLACWAPQAAASSFCQVINNPDGTPRTGSVASGGRVDINGSTSWASNTGDSVSLNISNVTGGSLSGTFSGADVTIDFYDAGAFQGTVGNYYSGGGGTILLTSSTGGFDYTISCTSALPVLASVSPASGATGTSVTLSGQSLYGFDNEVSITIGGVVATIDSNVGTSITTTVPAGLAAGSHDVTVTTDAGASTLPDAFTILAANQSPVINAPGSQTVEQDGALVFSSGNGNLISVGDPDAGSGTLQVELAATNGLTTLGSAAGLTFLVGDGTGDAAMTFQGTLSNINAALNGTTYTPTSGYSGSASLQIVSDDLGNTGTGGAMTDTDVVTITVLAPDTDPPEVTAIDRVDASPTNAGSVHYAVTFSEAVTGVDAADFALTSTGTAAGTVAQIATSDSIQYTVTVNGVGGDGTLRLDLNGSGTGIIDGAGNAAAGFTGGQAYIVDTVAPVVESVSVPADGRYQTGDALDFTVNLSESVVVDTSGGTPHLSLTLDSASRQATYVSGSGTHALTFRYMVVDGDRDNDGVSLGASLVADGATVRDAAGNDAAPPLNAVGATSGVLVGKGDQTITFDAQAAQAFVAGGTFALDPVATASSGLPVSYGTQTAGVCTISGTTVAMQSAGTCTIAANQAGDADYEAAVTVTQDIAIGHGNQTISFGAQAAQTFVAGGTFALAPAATASSGLPVSYATQTAAVCAISGTTVTMQSAGTCTIAADQAGDADYQAAATVTQDIAIGQASQTITFGAQATRAFVSGGTFALDPVATASSGLPVSYATQTAAVCTINGTTVTMQSAGTCTVAADQAGDDDYAAAATVTQSIAFGQAAQAITQFVANPEAPTYASGGTFSVSATGGDSGNPVVFTSTSPQVCAVSGSTVTMLSASTCVLTADQAGSDDYAAAAQATLEVVIAAATPTLAWLDDLQKVLGEPAFDLPDPNSDSAGAFSFESSNAEVATVSGSTVTIVGTGTTTLMATQAANGNYTEGTVSLVLAVMTRPDPTLDPEVVGGLQAQVDTSVRFANAQQDNIRGRLRQLRDGRGNPSANNMTFSASAGYGPGLSLGAEQLAGGMPTLAQNWGLWVAGTISLGERDTRSGANGFDFRSDGVTLGLDRLVGQHLVLGVAGGLGWNDTDFDDSPSQQDARQRSLALYGLWRGDGHLFVDGQLGLGRLDFDLWRWSAVANATGQARREGDQLFGGLTFGYQQTGEHGRLAGYGRYDASHTTLDAYREQGLGIHDLSYDQQTVDNSTLALGVEGSHQFKTTAVSLRPFWSIEYRQALENRGDARLNYVLLPVAQDYLLGMRSYNDDTLALGAGLDIDMNSGWSLSFLLRREQSSGIGSANSYGLRISRGQASGVGGAGYAMPGIDPQQAIDPQTGLPLRP